MNDIQLIAFGASTGGVKALELILPALPANYPIPIVIIQHIHKDADTLLLHHLTSITPLTVLEAADEMMVQANTIYLAPPAYHLLIEQNKHFSLCYSEKVSYCRPSIDVFFESASEVYKQHLMGILLSGGNQDGTQGAREIKSRSGTIIVQDPSACEAITMPKSAIISGIADAILPPQKMTDLLLELGHAKENHHR